MGNNSTVQNKKPFRWFEYKSYNIDDENEQKSYYNSLIQNHGYLIPLSIEQSANLEKQLNLNNEGLSTKYFFKYDYKDKLLTVKKNDRSFKRLKTPVEYKNYKYKIKRDKRFSQNSFKYLKPNSYNYINDLKLFFYNDIFNEFKIGTNDKFVLKFVNHCILIHSGLVDIINKSLKNHLKNFHKMNEQTEFNFEMMKQILIKDFIMYKNKLLYIYPKYFLKDMSQDNFDSNIIQMIIEEGELSTLINKVYYNNLDEPNLLFYLLCLQFAFDNKYSIKEVTTCYKTIDNKNNDFLSKENIIEGNYLMNFEYMSVSKDKNILNISSNDNEEDNECINQTIIEIDFEKPIIKNWYLSLKFLDTEKISQFPIEHEIIIQPYSIFEITEVKEFSNNNLYIKLLLRTNALNNLSGNIPRQIQMNLGICNDIREDDINKAYPNVNLEKIVSISFNNINQIIKNKTNLGLMKNIRILDLSNQNLTDKNIKELIPFIKELKFLNYINLSLNNLSHKSLELLSEIIPQFPFLEHIILDQNSFGDEGMIALSKGLSKLDNLKSLSAVYNQIRTDGLDNLSKELKRFNNLYYLNLSNNYIFYEEIDEFVSALKYMNNLIELNLSSNQISSEGLSFIAEILPDTIQKLSFTECEIYQDGFTDLGSYLYRIPNLTSLNIYGNRNGPSGISSLLDGFEYCPFLFYIDFGCNRIEDCDIVLFLKKIRNIKNVKSLILKENYLTDDSIFFLMQCINILRDLEILDISWNSLEGANLDQFFVLLSKFAKLRTINIEGNPCESQDKNALVDILNKNNTKENIDKDLLWKYEKGKFAKKCKLYNNEDFINKYFYKDKLEEN